MALAGYGDLVWEIHGNETDNVESLGLVYGVPGGLPMLGTARSGRGDPYEPAHRPGPLGLARSAPSAKLFIYAMHAGENRLATLRILSRQGLVPDPPINQLQPELGL